MKNIFLLFLFVCFCVNAPAVRAQQDVAPAVVTPEIKPVPTYEMPQAEFEAKTRLVQDKPGGDNFLSYTVRIPSDWQQVKKEDGKKADPSNSSSSILGEVARFYGPSLLDSRSSFVLRSSDLHHDITAKNWFMNYILENGYNLQFLTEVSENRVEALFFQLEKDTAYLSRVVAEINGSRMMLAIYSVPESRFPEEKVIQANSLKSFRFLNPQKTEVEPRRTYAFLNLLRFDYPESWRLLAPNIYSVEVMDARIINSKDDETLNGEINIRVVSTELDTTLAEEIKAVQSEIEKRGLTTGKLIEQPHNFKFHDNIYFSRVEVYAATSKDGRLIDHEYWVGVLIEDRYFYIVTMLTPARTIDFYNWATNSEAFQTVVETLRP